MSTCYTLLQSPVGPLRLAVSSRGVCELSFADPARALAPPADDWHLVKTLAHPAEAQLQEYFAGERRRFDLELDMRGTEFQKRVWLHLVDIPYGETRSYGEIAKALGSPGAARAVGAANGKNPVAIIVPCHRVIGSTGELTGFAGGLEIKSQLLSTEQRRAGRQLSLDL